MLIELELIDETGHKLKHQAISKFQTDKGIGLTVVVEPHEFNFWHEWKHENWEAIRSQIKGKMHNDLIINFDKTSELMTVIIPKGSVPVMLNKVIEDKCNINVGNNYIHVNEYTDVFNIGKIKKEMNKC